MLRKEDGKSCVTSVTIILFETTFRQTSLSLILRRPRSFASCERSQTSENQAKLHFPLNRSFCKGSVNISVK